MKVLWKFFWILLLICSNLSLEIKAQNKTFTKYEIDSLLDKYGHRWDSVAYRTAISCLHVSESLYYVSGILRTYMILANYHSRQLQLDSLIFYANQFEHLETQYPDILIRKKYVLNMSYNWQALGLDEQAIEYGLDYLEIVTNDSSNMNSLVNAKSNLAFLYAEKGHYIEAVDLMKLHVRDTARMGTSAFLKFTTVLSMMYQFLEKPEISEPLNRIAYKKCQQMQDTARMIFVQHHLSYDYYLKGDYQRAINVIQFCEREFPKWGWNYAMHTIYEFSALYYYAAGELDQAIAYMTKAIASDQSLNARPDMYTELIKYHEEKQDWEKVGRLALEKSQVIDSIRTREKQVFVDYYSAKTKFIEELRQNEQLANEKAMLELRSERQNLFILLMAIGIIFLVVVLTLLLISRKYAASKRKVVELEDKEKELLENHVKVRENELNALLITQSGQAKELSKIWENIKHKVENLEIKKEFDDIFSSMQNFVRGFSDIDIFSQRLESQYPSLIYELQNKHPNLSKSDIKHCLLVKLDLSLKESADLLGVSLGTVKTARSRAKTKMKLEATESMKSYLEQILRS